MDSKSSYKMKQVTNGYMRENYMNHPQCDQFKVSLIELIMVFLGNIIIVFDVYPQQYNQFFFEDGKIMKIDMKTNDTDWKSFPFGCSVNDGWKKGINKISFKSATDSYLHDAIGITSNLMYLIEQNKWYSYCESGDYYVKNGTYLTTSINDKHEMYDPNAFNGVTANPNDVFTLIYDGDKATLQFMLNGEQKGKTMKVKKDEIYYPFICVDASPSIKYKSRQYTIIDDNKVISNKIDFISNISKFWANLFL